MAFFNKRMILLFNNLFLLAGIGTTIANYSTSVIEPFAAENERTQTFLWGNLSGTLPTGSSYVNINATTNPCGFTFSGNAQRGGTTPNFVLGITSGRTPTAEIIITKPDYIIEFTAIEITAYSASGNLRYLAINGVKDDTPVSSAGNYSSPINIGKISINGSSVTITSPDGNILIKEFILYYV